MNWDYRIIKKEYKNDEGVVLDASYFIIEAFYDENGKVFMCSQEPEGPAGDTIEEMIHNWCMLAEAFNKPILDFDNIPEDGAVHELDERMKELQDEDGNMRPTDELIEEGKLIPHETVMKNLRDKLAERAEENPHIGSSLDDCEDELFGDIDLDAHRAECQNERNASEMRHIVDRVGVPWASIAMEAFAEYLEEIVGEEDADNDIG